MGRAQQSPACDDALIDPAVAAADRILRRHGIRYVVVGGQAVARRVDTGTLDVDVMVTTADYASAVRTLRKDTELAFRDEQDGVAFFSLRNLEGTGFDLLDARPFAGARPGDTFFDFLVTEGSTEEGGVRFATTPVVWYTRLLATHWKVYAEKIVTNIGHGAPPAAHLRKVRQIAQRFGTEKIVQPRIEYVREEMLRSTIGEEPPED
jgi:hypothetical protein